MSAKNRELRMLMCLLSGILFCTLGCNGVVPNINLKGNPDSLAVRGMKITMDVYQREEFFTQMRKFADKHSLEYTLSLYGSDGTFFLVAIYGDGFHISASDVPNSPREIDIGFYDETSTPTPQETVDELFNDLKSFLGEIPDATVVET